MAETVDFQVLQTNTIVSSIAQRPRRQVRHKFIKSANVNVIEKSTNSVASSDVSEESASSVKLLDTLSPNSKLRLVPMVHRLPVNVPKLNLEDSSGNDPNEIDKLDEMQLNEASNVQNESFTTILTDMNGECYEETSNSKQLNRRGRQLQQAVCPVESHSATEINNEEEREETAKYENEVEPYAEIATETELTSGKTFLLFIFV